MSALFEILGPMRQVEIIASGRGVRAGRVLRKRFGGRNWKKMKGVALVRNTQNEIYEAEIHWYECHGVGRQLFKIKRPTRG